MTKEMRLRSLKLIVEDLEKEDKSLTKFEDDEGITQHSSYNMDEICGTCHKRYGEHFGSDCNATCPDEEDNIHANGKGNHFSKMPRKYLYKLIISLKNQLDEARTSKEYVAELEEELKTYKEAARDFIELVAPKKLKGR
jgi:hypothetical protein